MALGIQVFRGEEPQSGIQISYMKSRTEGACNITNSEGYVHFFVNPGKFLWIKIGDKKFRNYFLNLGTNVFRI